MILDRRKRILYLKSGVEQLELQTMSSGEETRLKIAQALFEQIHGILADEPTSHLDREGIDFLIGQLKYFSGVLSYKP